jgi:hypothetical protein
VQKGNLLDQLGVPVDAATRKTFDNVAKQDIERLQQRLAASGKEPSSMAPAELQESIR